MKKAVIYWSGTGNTAAMASAIAAGMGEGTELYSVDQFTGDIAEYDKIAFGCPAMGDEVLEEGEFDPFFSSIEGKLGDWAERTTKTGANLYDDGLMVNGFPDADAKVQCTAFGEGFGAY